MPFGPDCIYKGIMIRVLFAFSWGDLPLFRDHYPGRPANLMQNNKDPRAVRRLAQWFHNPVADGQQYGQYTYYNIYSVFLFLLRRMQVVT